MQPASSTRPTPARPRTPLSERAARIRFRRAVTLMLMTLVVPGSAQLVAGNRSVGRAAIRIWLGLLTLVGTAAVVGWWWHGAVFWAVLSTTWLSLVRWLLTLLAVGWAALFIDAWRLAQPLTLRQGHRLAIVGLNGALCFSVAGALLFGAHVVTVQRDFLKTMFSNGEASGATDGRYNVLLIGGDSGDDRWGLRTDSMTVASIDAETGQTILFGLPRNLENFDFAPGSTMAKQFPHGFDCGDDACYLNGVSTWAEDHPQLFPRSKHPGVQATEEAIEGITGLTINYWAMVNLQGFSDLVDAVGGVTLDVRDRIPVGGLGDDVTGYIEPGVRKLDGHDTLWFARAREGSDDYSRMARQKCVMSAMLDQLSPETVATSFGDIASATTGMVQTNLPRSEVGRFVQLALKAKSQKIHTVSFVPPMIDTAEPDLALIKKKVQESIAGEDAPAAKKKKPGEAQTTGGSKGTRDDGYAANDTTDLGSAC